MWRQSDSGDKLSPPLLLCGVAGTICLDAEGPGSLKPPRPCGVADAEERAVRAAYFTGTTMDLLVLLPKASVQVSVIM